MKKLNKFNKDAARSVTNRFVADVTGLIYNGLVHQVPKNRTLWQIKKELAWYNAKIGGISNLAAHKLWLAAVKSYQDTSKTAYLSLHKIPKDINYQEKLKMRSEGVFLALNVKVIESGLLASVGNSVLNEKEYDGKHQNIVEMIDESRENDDYSPFYLSDSHINCAKDHLPYESRIYYDEKYTEYITDEEVLAKVNAYIRNHSCMSVQEVTGYPILFCTRNNCTHKLLPVPVDEVLGSSIKKMLIRHKMIINTKQVSYPETVYRSYQKKFLDYSALWKIMPCQELSEKLKNTKHLMNKWRKLF